MASEGQSDGVATTRVAMRAVLLFLAAWWIGQIPLVLGVIVPRYEAFFRDFGVQLDGLSLALVRTGQSASRVGLVGLIVLSLVVAGVVVAAGRSRVRSIPGLIALVLVGLIVNGAILLTLTAAMARVTTGLSR